MEYIKYVHDRYIPHPKTENFKSTVFPFLSDETIKNLLKTKFGLFLLRVSGTLPYKMVISVRNEEHNVESHFFEEGDSLAVLHNLDSMWTPLGMRNPKHIEWFTKCESNIKKSGQQRVYFKKKIFWKNSLLPKSIKLLKQCTSPMVVTAKIHRLVPRTV